MVDFDRTASADLSLVSVARMSDEEAREALMARRAAQSKDRIETVAATDHRR
jgi:hypothetical protein